MTLSAGYQLYFLACNGVWSILSMYFELLDIAPIAFASRHESWEEAHEALAGWLLDERDFVLKTGQLTNTSKDLLIAKSNQMEYELIRERVVLLQSAATRAHVNFSLLDADLWLYRYYCSFVVQILLEFDTMFRHLNHELSVVEPRYRDNIKLFDELAKQLVAESQLETQAVDVDAATRNPALSVMNAFVTQAGASWTLAILTAARDLVA